MVEHTYNVVNIAKMIGCKPTDFREIYHFIQNWNLAVHGGKP